MKLEENMEASAEKAKQAAIIHQAEAAAAAAEAKHQKEVTAAFNAQHHLEPSAPAVNPYKTIDLSEIYGDIEPMDINGKDIE